MGVLSRSGTSTPAHPSVSSTPLFEIRLHNLDHDVIVLKGDENEASSALLAGKIVLSLVEPIQIKKLSLKLFADIRLNWIEHLESATTTYSKPTRFMKRVYEYNWDSAEIQSFGATTEPKKQSSILLKRSSKSSSSLYSLSANHNRINLGSEQHLTLPAGNHEIPFSLILPGNAPQSVEGLPGGSLVYKLQASLERGKFSKRKVCTKHLRVIRTLTTDAAELQETLSIDNSWPNKVDYTISTPARAVAVGSMCPVHFLLAPMLKGLKLGKVSIKLVEYYSFVGQNARVTHANDRVIAECNLSKPADSDYELTEEEAAAKDQERGYWQRLSYDRWEFEKSLCIPPSLTKCTQDVTVGKNLKVRHKLSIVVALKNPNGHTSELRATLPVIVYISPFVSVSARYDEQEAMYRFSDTIPELSAEHISKNGKKKPEATSSSSSSYTDLRKVADESAADNEVLFEGLDQSAVTVDSATGVPDLVAPPNYGDHVYDKLWSGIDTPNSPGSLTPGIRTPPSGSSAAITPRQFHSQLTQHLNELHLQRLAEENEGESPDGAPHDVTAAAVDSDAGDISVSASVSASASAPTDYFSVVSESGPVAATPSAPAFIHLSRANSSQALHSLGNSGLHSPVGSPVAWNRDFLSQVPSYEVATKSGSDAALLSPAYNVPSQSTSEFSNAVESFAPMTMSLPATVPTRKKKTSDSQSSTPVRPTAKRNSSFLLSFGVGSRNSSRPAMERASSAMQLSSLTQMSPIQPQSTGSSSSDEGLEMGVKGKNKQKQ